MTEREYYVERKPEAARREVYHETEVDLERAPADAHREIYQERVDDLNGERVMHSEHVSVPSAAAERAARVERARQIIYFIFGAIETLLALRFILLLLGANPDSPFVNLIYGLSGAFVLPFQGIFGEPQFDGSVIEWASLVGIVVYMLVAYGIARIVELAVSPARQRPTR